MRSASEAGSIALPTSSIPLDAPLCVRISRRALERLEQDVGQLRVLRHQPAEACRRDAVHSAALDDPGDQVDRLACQQVELAEKRPGPKRTRDSSGASRVAGWTISTVASSMTIRS